MPRSRRQSSSGRLRIGFDTEFVRAGIEDVEGEEDAREVPDRILLGNEVLCYTAAIRNLTTDAVDTGIFHLEPGKGGKSHRIDLNTFLGMLIDHGLQVGLIDEVILKTRLPAEKKGSSLRIDLVAHFSRADLCGFRDWKKLRRSFDSVRGTYCTTTFPVVRTVWLKGYRPIVCSIRLYDSMLLAPAGYQSLDALGKLIGVEKLEIPPERKARMDLLRKEEPVLFKDYAIRDAVIAEAWLGLIGDFLHDEFGLSGDVPVTLASAGVNVFRDMCEEDGVALYDFLGGKTKKEVYLPHPSIQDHLSLIANSYHGGRNEAFWCGPTLVGNISDIDIKGAYTSAMAGIRIPDWSGAEVTTDLARLAVIDTGMAFARVRFGFPPDTRYPGLPVRADGGRGLIYPLEGETHVTGPELVAALGQGADIEVLSGLVIPFDDEDDRRPFAAFSRRVADVRNKYRGNAVALEKGAKEIGNACYGKTAQAVDGFRTTGNGVRVRGKRVFNAREGVSIELPPSKITSPPIAAWITGMVRALCSECIATIPASRAVYTVTTDGWLTDATLEEASTAGPVAKAFAAMREVVAGDCQVLELKHGARQCLVTKTRGTVTMETMHGLPPVLARAGQRMEERFENVDAENAAWVELYRTRTYDLQTTRRQLISLRDQWKHVTDLVELVRTVRMNLEFDFKRRLTVPRDMGGLLSSDTKPWRSIEEFESYRDSFEQWRKTKRRCCVTKADFQEFEEWRTGKAVKSGMGIAAQTAHPPLVQMTFRAWAQRLHRTPGGQYEELARITSRWWPTTTHAIKASKRRGDLRPVTEIESWREIEWIHAVARRWPGIAWWNIVAPASWAAEELILRDYEWWRPQLDAPPWSMPALIDEVTSVEIAESGASGGSTPPLIGEAPLCGTRNSILSIGRDEPSNDTAYRQSGAFSENAALDTRLTEVVISSVEHGLDQSGASNRDMANNNLPPVSPRALARQAGWSEAKTRRLYDRARKAVRQSRPAASRASAMAHGACVVSLDKSVLIEWTAFDLMIDALGEDAEDSIVAVIVE